MKTQIKAEIIYVEYGIIIYLKVIKYGRQDSYAFLSSE